MNINKTFVLVITLPLIFTVGCASVGNKKPKIFVDKLNSIPADIPSQFLDRYYFLIDKERKEFKKFMTDEEQQVFIDKFWLERDSDPSTPENEYKQEIDERIDNIVNKLFLSTSGVFGLSFKANGGFRGNMAKVYLLHGEPDVMDTIEGNSFVPLMLWVYFNPENGSILYAFLFYQKGGLGSFSLFPQDTYKLDPCGAVNEIKTIRNHTYFGSGNQACPFDVEDVFRELQTANSKGGILDGYIFAWSLFNFSQGGSISQGLALQAPKSASEIAKRSKARVTGEVSELIGTVGIDYILASCENCNSFIPAELQLEKEFVFSVRRSDIDWRAVGDEIKVELKIRIILEDIADQTLLIFEKKVLFKDKKDLIISDPLGRVAIPFLTVDEVAQIPVGTYQVSVYVKNITSGLMTKKYNTWSKEITKQNR